MNTARNRFHVITATEAGAVSRDSEDPNFAKQLYLELFYNLSTTPSLMDIFVLRLLDGETVLMESTPEIRAELRHQANIELGRAYMAAHGL